ncbi:MAG: YfiR family protein [Terriglobales bacterium]
MNRANSASRVVPERSAAARQRVLGSLWKVFLLGVCLLAAAAQAQSATEYQVKAAFLFNFARFVEWPADAFPNADSALQICVLGQDPFGRDFEQVIVDKTVNGHRIEIAHPDGVPQARACQILFIAASEKAHLPSILQGLKGASVLIVGDTPGFAALGGAINFVLDEGRVRFEINLKAAELAHLKISARLLTVAKVVLNGEPGGN